MIERERDPSTPLTFSFICPKGREDEVRELFESENLGRLNPNIQQGERFIYDLDIGEFQRVSGLEIHGVTDSGKVRRVLLSLAERGIAGYSRKTQVFFHTLDDLNPGE